MARRFAFAANERFGNRYPRHTDTEYYLQDVLGSVAGITDERGNQREEYCYDVWGNRYDRPNRKNGNSHNGVGWNASSATVFGFNGKRFDPKVGLYDYGFRDYKPDINRWTTVDPICSGKNWYAYVGNDPVNWVDLWGLDSTSYTNSSHLQSAIPANANPGIVGDFDVTVTTLATVNENEGTVTVSTTTTTGVYESYEVSSITTATVDVNDATYDSALLEDTPAFTNQGTASLGSTTLDLPSGYENLNVTVTTTTSYLVTTESGVYGPGSQTVEVPIGGNVCAGANN